jgi:hypothetical protein
VIEQIRRLDEESKTQVLAQAGQSESARHWSCGVSQAKNDELPSALDTVAHRSPAPQSLSLVHLAETQTPLVAPHWQICPVAQSESLRHAPTHLQKPDP